MTTPRTPVEPPSSTGSSTSRTGRSWTARENLADILERELLGPMNGPEEVLDGVPDSVYLVGRIAPFKLDRRHRRSDGRGHRRARYRRRGRGRRRGGPGRPAHRG